MIRNPERLSGPKAFPEGEKAIQLAVNLVQESTVETFPMLESHRSRLINTVRFAPLEDIMQMETIKMKSSPITLPFFQLTDPKKTVDQHYRHVDRDFPFYKDSDSATLYVAKELLPQIESRNEDVRIKAIVNNLVLNLTYMTFATLPAKQEAPEYLRPAIVDMATFRMQDILRKKHIDPKRAHSITLNIGQLLIHNPETKIVFDGAGIVFVGQGQTTETPDLVIGNQLKSNTVAVLSDPAIERTVLKIYKMHPQIKKYIPFNKTTSFEMAKRHAEEQYLAIGIDEKNCNPQQGGKRIFGEKARQFILKRYISSDIPLDFINFALDPKVNVVGQNPMTDQEENWMVKYLLPSRNDPDEINSEEKMLLYPE